jgi:hypothetical protein
VGTIPTSLAVAIAARIGRRDWVLPRRRVAQSATDGAGRWRSLADTTHHEALVLPLTFRAARRIGSISLLIASAAGCGRVITMIPIRGDAPSVAQLAGDWEGTYDSPESGRSGTIRFHLQAGKDTASGEIIMVPNNVASGSGWENSTAVRTTSAGSELLTIRFVEVANGEVRGTLDPYRDPDCGCGLTTTFRGRLAGDVIEGTFDSKGDGFFHVPTSGTWRVTRVRKAPPAP